MSIIFYTCISFSKNVQALLAFAEMAKKVIMVWKKLSFQTKVELNILKMK